MSAPFVLGPQHRTQFCSGSAPLDPYFQQQVSQDARRRTMSCFNALAKDQRIAGFQLRLPEGRLQR